jgi:hypothetical protein
MTQEPKQSAPSEPKGYWKSVVGECGAVESKVFVPFDTPPPVSAAQPRKMDNPLDRPCMCGAKIGEGCIDVLGYRSGLIHETRKQAVSAAQDSVLPPAERYYDAHDRNGDLYLASLNYPMDEGDVRGTEWVTAESYDALLSELSSLRSKSGEDARLREAMQEFLTRCEEGNATSGDLYVKFKELLVVRKTLDE